MYEDDDRNHDDQSSLTIRGRRSKSYSSIKPKQKQLISKRNIAVIVVGVLLVGLLVFFLSVVREGKRQSEKGKPCEETQEALRKQKQKVKAMEASINRLRGQLQTAKNAVSLANSGNKKDGSTKSPTNSKPTSSATPTAPPVKQLKEGQLSQGAKGAPPHLQNPSVVIDIEYDEADYLPLPIDFFRKNAEGKSLPEVLYSAELKKKREDFHRERITFMDGKNNFPQVFLTKYNNPLTEDAEREGRTANEKEWDRLNAKFGLDKVTSELPMCIMVPGYNNNANFRIEYNLNSIFTQNYTNYRVVVIDDKSNDGSGAVYRSFFAFHRIDKKRYTYIENSKRVTALQNIYMGSLNHCAEDAIVVTIDADDEFIGRNVLNVFNWGYQTKKSGVLYTNFMWYQHRATLMYGFTSDYSQHVKSNNLFRSTPMQFSHLRSYRNELIAQIDPKDLQDDNGVFFTITYDIALFIPLMELACGRVHKIDGEYHYLYNTGTGLNDYNDRGRQVQVQNKIRGKKKYECYKPFDERMKN